MIFEQGALQFDFSLAPQMMSLLLSQGSGENRNALNYSGEGPQLTHPLKAPPASGLRVRRTHLRGFCKCQFTPRNIFKENCFMKLIHAYCEHFKQYRKWRKSERESCSVVSDSLWPYRLYVAHQAPLSMEFFRPEYWSSRSLPQEIWDRTEVSCIAGGFFTVWATREDQVKKKIIQIPSQKSGFIGILVNIFMVLCVYVYIYILSKLRLL